MNRMTIAFSVLLLAHGVSVAQKDGASIAIDVRSVLGKTNPLVFGNNVLAYQKGSWKGASPDYWDRGAGIWNPDLKQSVPEIVSLAKQAGISIERFPGALHYFDWKKAIGPVSERPDQKFGIPEFLQFCSDITAIPLFTIPEFLGTAQDAADLVEYLNAPNDGNHPWAKRRANDGHPGPYGVLWFEYGNETNLGDGIGKKMEPQEYGKNYLAYRRSMKSVDPHIVLGVVGTNEFPPFDSWLRPVMEVIGKDIDFVIQHAYIPSYRGDDGIPQANELFSIALASESQIQNYYDKMNSLTRETAGKPVPIGVTEYNGLFVQDKPVPYRLTLGNALLNAEMIKVFLNPRNNISEANSWEFSNEYWGAIRGYAYKGEPIVKRPLYYVFQLYHEHFGNELVSTDVHSGVYNSDGGYGVLPAKGAGQDYRLLSDAVIVPPTWDFSIGLNFSQHIDGDALTVEFNGNDVNYFHAAKTIDADPSTGYHVTAMIKTEGLSSANGACIEVTDARGWNTTHFTSASANIAGTHDWQKVSADFTSLPDTKKIQIRARRMGGGGAVNGKAFFRDVSVQKFIPQMLPAVQYLSVNASRGILKGGTGTNEVYLMVVNRNMTSSISTSINLLGMNPHTAKAFVLTGPSVDATNEVNPNNVSVQEHDYEGVKNGFIVVFPPHSLTALEIK